MRQRIPRIAAIGLLTLCCTLTSLARAADSVADASTPSDKTPAAKSVLDWTELPTTPVPLAGSFAGIVDDHLVSAGGADFKNGVKSWTNRMFVLDSPKGKWRELNQKLPTGNRAYGASVATDDGPIWIGGSDKTHAHTDVWRLHWTHDHVTFENLPPLPAPLANTCAARLGHILYVAGGIESTHGRTTHHFFALDLDAQPLAWKKLPTWPGPDRMLAVAAAQNGCFYLISGVQLVGPDANMHRIYLKDAYRYKPGATEGTGWTRIADIPDPAVAAPSPAAPIGLGHILVFGGDDGSHVDIPLGQPHPGFSRTIWDYHTITNTWIRRGQTPIPLVTDTLVPWQGGFTVAGGELKPGIRSSRCAIAVPHHERVGFGALNYITLGVYLLGIVGVGLLFARSNRNTDAFFRGGQRVPWWAVGLSIYSTMLSSITYMGIPAKAFASDWTFALANLSVLLITPLVVYAYLPFFRKLDVTSAYEYLERRFNLASRLFGSLSFITFQIGRMAIVLFLPALALSTVSSINIYWCIILMGVLCAGYTVVGGIEAVIWTDVIQTIVLIAGALIALALVLMNTDGGVGGIISTIHHDHKTFENLNWGVDLALPTVWIILFGNAMSNLLPYTASQDVVQRYLTTANEKQAARSIWTNAIIILPTTLLFFGVGSALYVFYKQHPALLDPTLPIDSIFPQFIVHQMPAGLAGLVVAGIFAAAQSTVSSSLNSISACIVTDFVKRFRDHADDAGDLRAARWVTLIFGVVGIAGALLLATLNVQHLWDVFLALVGLAGGALAGLFALGIFTRRANGVGAIIGAVAGAVALGLVKYLTNVNLFLYGVVGIGVCFVVGYLASLLVGKSGHIDGLTIYTLDRRPSQTPTLAAGEGSLESP